MTFEEVSDLVLSQKGVEWGFLQHTQHLDQFNAVRVAGGAGAWQQGSKRYGNYRVVIATGKTTVDVTGDKLIAAVSEAFEKAKLPVPNGLTEPERKVAA